MSSHSPVIRVIFNFFLNLNLVNNGSYGRNERSTHIVIFL